MDHTYGSHIAHRQTVVHIGIKHRGQTIQGLNVSISNMLRWQPTIIVWPLVSQAGAVGGILCNLAALDELKQGHTERGTCVHGLHGYKAA